MNILTILLRKKSTPSGRPEVTLVLEGILDKTSAALFTEKFQEALQSNPESLTLDIAGLRHISGDGIRQLTKAQELTDAHGGTLFIVNAAKQTDDTRLTSRSLEGGVTCVVIVGNLDQRGTSAVERPLIDLCRAPGPHIIIDLSSVDMLASLGIRMLLQAIKDATVRNGRVLFLNPALQVSAALDFSGLTQYVARGRMEDVAASLSKISK
jgi:anti-anti-sigma factor